jgi:hypothetical protein
LLLIGEAPLLRSFASYCACYADPSIINILTFAASFASEKLRFAFLLSFAFREAPLLALLLSGFEEANCSVVIL